MAPEYIAGIATLLTIVFSMFSYIVRIERKLSRLEAKIEMICQRLEKD
jgi:hypothetical protein